MTIAPAQSSPAPVPSANGNGVRSIGRESFMQFLLWPAFALGSISFIEPSPADLFLLPLILVWFLLDFKFHTALIPIVTLTLVRMMIEILNLFPYMTDADATSYVFYSLIVTVMCLFCALFFSNNTGPRVEIFIKAYFWSCILASLIAIVTYFDVGGTAETFAPGGRSLGSFKDPNVMGSYCILGALHALQAVLVKSTRHVAGMVLGFLIISAGILLTFSRGSLGAMVLEILMVVGFTFLTAHSRSEARRVVVVFTVVAGLAALGLAVLLSNSDFRELFTQRTTLIQDYDAGETGRFGNQARSIPMILDRLWTGFGPLQYRKVFDLEPHNSYIGAFANAGIVGGFTFIALVLMTGFVGFRLCLVRSPYQRMAQVMWPALFGHFLQAFQIDIDHWRFFMMLIGAVWALEAGRVRWMRQKAVQPIQAASRTARESMSA